MMESERITLEVYEHQVFRTNIPGRYKVELLPTDKGRDSLIKELRDQLCPPILKKDFLECLDNMSVIVTELKKFFESK
jgi:hypothetical protein